MEQPANNPRPSWVPRVRPERIEVCNVSPPSEGSGCWDGAGRGAGSSAADRRGMKRAASATNVDDVVVAESRARAASRVAASSTSSGGSGSTSSSSSCSSDASLLPIDLTASPSGGRLQSAGQNRAIPTLQGLSMPGPSGTVRPADASHEAGVRDADSVSMVQRTVGGTSPPFSDMHLVEMSAANGTRSMCTRQEAELYNSRDQLDVTGDHASEDSPGDVEVVHARTATPRVGDAEPPRGIVRSRDGLVEGSSSRPFWHQGSNTRPQAEPRSCPPPSDSRGREHDAVDSGEPILGGSRSCHQPPRCGDRGGRGRHVEGWAPTQQCNNTRPHPGYRLGGRTAESLFAQRSDEPFTARQAEVRQSPRRLHGSSGRPQLSRQDVSDTEFLPASVFLRDETGHRGQSRARPAQVRPEPRLQADLQHQEARDFELAQLLQIEEEVGAEEAGSDGFDAFFDEVSSTNRDPELEQAQAMAMLPPRVAAPRAALPRAPISQRPPHAAALMMGMRPGRFADPQRHARTMALMMAGMRPGRNAGAELRQAHEMAMMMAAMGPRPPRGIRGPRGPRGPRGRALRQLLASDRDFNAEDYEMLLELDSTNTRQDQSNGAAEMLMARLPVHKVDGGTVTQCSICLEDMAMGDEVRTLPCMHVFHRKCIDRWMQTPGPPRCPVDQRPIEL